MGIKSIENVIDSLIEMWNVTNLGRIDKSGQ